MKKLLCILMIMLMIVSLCACGNENWGVGNYEYRHVHICMALLAIVPRLNPGMIMRLASSCIPKNSVISTALKALISYLNLATIVLSVNNE